jgi:hypothetical protein
MRSGDNGRLEFFGLTSVALRAPCVSPKNSKSVYDAPGTKCIGWIGTHSQRLDREKEETNRLDSHIRLHGPLIQIRAGVRRHLSESPRCVTLTQILLLRLLAFERSPGVNQ